MVVCYLYPAHSSKFLILHLTAYSHAYEKRTASVKTVVKNTDEGDKCTDCNLVMCASDKAVQCEVFDRSMVPYEMSRNK
jgi:CMP-2-keto-3-deoxyoctulosonic acid synthetase